MAKKKAPPSSSTYYRNNQVNVNPGRVGTDFLPVLISKLDPVYYRLVKKIKRLLDPNGIMKPGIIVPER